MRKIDWVFVVASLCACASPVDHELEEVVLLPDMHPSEWLIDLRDETRAYEVSGLLADRMAEIELICPDGTEMDLRTWVRLTNAELPEPLDVDVGIMLASSERVARTAVTSTCVEECYECPDGAWVCQLVGPGCESWERRQREANESSDNDPRLQTDPSSPTPQEPRNAAPDSPNPGDPTPSQPREPSQPPPHL